MSDGSITSLPTDSSCGGVLAYNNLDEVGIIVSLHTDGIPRYYSGHIQLSKKFCIYTIHERGRNCLTGHNRLLLCLPFLGHSFTYSYAARYQTSGSLTRL